MFPGIKSLRTCLDDGVDMLELQPLFLKNTAYISRFIKLFRSQFRSFPILQHMRKIKLAIEKIDSNNAREPVSSILSGFPVHLGTGYDLELPSQQFFDYCLAKVLAHCQIMVRLVVCSKKCALYFVHFLQYGHFIEVSTMMIGLLGHIWQQARQCLLRMDAFYNQLVTYRSLFPIRKTATVQEDYEFPTNLVSFVGDGWKEEVDVLKDETTTTSFASSDAFRLISKDETMEITPETVPVIRKTPINRMIVPKEDLADDDMGEALSRDTLKPTGKPEVLGKKTLINFLRTENEYRNKRSSKSVTPKVSQFQWEKFRALMERKMKFQGVNIKDIFDKEWAQLCQIQQ